MKSNAAQNAVRAVSLVSGKVNSLTGSSFGEYEADVMPWSRGYWMNEYASTLYSRMQACQLLAIHVEEDK
jgi:hypothetical protein